MYKTFRIEIQKGGPNNSALLQDWFLSRNQAALIQAIQLFRKIGSPPHPWKLGALSNLRQFQKTGEN